MLAKVVVKDGQAGDAVRTITVLELEHALRAAEEAHAKHPAADWPEFYAKFLLAREWK